MTNVNSKKQAILQNVDDIEPDNWSQLLPVLNAIGFDVIQTFTKDYIEQCNDTTISKIYSSTISIDSLLSQDALSYSLQFLALNERMRLSILSKSFANLMQSNAIWNDVRIHVYPSKNINSNKHKIQHKIQVHYDSSESPTAMVPCILFGMDNFRFLNVIEYLCVNVHEWNFINENAWNQLQKHIKYLYITHNDKYVPSFDILDKNYKCLKYLRIDLSSNYQGVISLELPLNLEALSISCLFTNIHSWNYLAQSMMTDCEELITGTNNRDENNDLVLFPFGNPNKETILATNVFMQQRFENIKCLRLCDCNFMRNYEIQSILDACKKLQYLSLIRVEWKYNKSENDVMDRNIIIPSSLVGLCLIDSCLNIDLSNCGNMLWEISINIKSLAINNGVNEAELLIQIGSYCKSLRQMVLYGDVSTQRLKIITSKLNANKCKIRYVISDKESGMNKYWSKKFGVVFTRMLNPYLYPNNSELLRGIKNKTSMFDATSIEKIPWQYYTNYNIT
eukprot:468220_1